MSKLMDCVHHNVVFNDQSSPYNLIVLVALIQKRYSIIAHGICIHMQVYSTIIAAILVYESILLNNYIVTTHGQ